MKKIIKKASLSIILLSLIFIQSGCIELWGRYQTSSPTSSYLTAYKIAMFAQVFSTTMLLATTPLTIKSGAKDPMTFVFPPQGPTLLTHSIMAVFSKAYAFQGFGTAGTKVGEYRIIDPNTTLIRLASIIAISNLLAYIDLNQNNQYDEEYEPTMAWQIVSIAVQALLITFPLWAGGPSNQAYYNFNDFAALTLFANILSYPSIAGNYPIFWIFTAMNPTTGGKGSAISQMTTPVTVGLLTAVQISMLNVILGLQMFARQINAPEEFKELILNSNGRLSLAELIYIIKLKGNKDSSP